ncbi:MAG TPA: hypothetical protein VN932_12935 [Rhizomicrobium sp.]|nr:hypothetical protein [Rhizomicrobium sp.]
MSEIAETANHLAGAPLDNLAIIVGLAGIALAAFAIYVVLTMVKLKGRR